MEGARPMTSVDEYIDEVLKRGLDDWIQAAEVVSVVRSSGGETSEARMREVALEVIAAVLRRGLMKAGDVTKDGFVEWNMMPDESLERITAGWNALAKSPELGEVCWLSNTSLGDLQAGRRRS